MHDRLQTELKAHPSVHDWKLWESRSRELQVYGAEHRQEALRQVETRQCEVTIYHDHERNGRRERGETSIDLNASQIDMLADLLDEAIVVADVSVSDHYNLPDPAPCAVMTVTDERIVKHAEELAAHISSIIMDESRHEGVRAIQQEIFLKTRESRLTTSRGMDISFPDTVCFGEVVLLAERKSEVAEYYISWNERTVDEQKIRGVVRDGARCAWDSLTKRPPRSGRFPIVLLDNSINVLFRPLIYHASAQALYDGLNRCKAGEYLVNRAAMDEPLTMSMDGTIPFALGSVPCDEDGIPSSRHVLVENGVIRSFWATNRFAEQLSLPCTGQFSNLVIEPGRSSMDELCSINGGDVVYLLESLSSLEPNIHAGTFTSEIKLGYELTSHGRTPIRGGSLAGNVFRSLETARFSRELMQRARYLGPSALRLESVRIAGEES